MFPKKHQLKDGTSLKITYKAFGNGLTLNACKEMLTQTEKAGVYFLGKLDYFRDTKSKNFGYSALRLITEFCESQKIIKLHKLNKNVRKRLYTFWIKNPLKLTSAENFIYSTAKQTSEYLSPRNSHFTIHMILFHLTDIRLYRWKWLPWDYFERFMIKRLRQINDVSKPQTCELNWRLRLGAAESSKTHQSRESHRKSICDVKTINKTRRFTKRGWTWAFYCC